MFANEIFPYFSKSIFLCYDKKIGSNFFNKSLLADVDFIDDMFFNSRINFLLFFRYPSYIEAFRRFKNYEFISKTRLKGYKGNLFKYNNHLNHKSITVYKYKKLHFLTKICHQIKNLFMIVSIICILI
jgi:hypothetical protein